MGRVPEQVPTKPALSHNEMHRIRILRDAGYDTSYDTSAIDYPGRAVDGIEVAAQRPESIGWNAGMLQSGREGGEMEEVDMELPSHIHTQGSTFDNVSRQPLERVLEQNQF